MKHLSEIADQGNSDKKRGAHGYVDYYHNLFSPIRLKPITLLEVGILGGDSITMWADFFPHPKTRIIGVDLHDRGYRLPRDKRVELYFGDITSKETQDRLPASLTVLIDDGSHFASHQMDTFTALWPRIVPGGIYVVEDLHVCHSVQHRDAHCTFIEYCAKLATEMQDERGADGCGAYDPLNIRADIASIELRRGMAIIRKRL